MGFTLQLANDLVDVDAGSPSPVVLTLVNKGDTTDRYEIEVEGIDAEWKAIPVPVFTVEPGESHSERVFIRPPRTSESSAGNYPFAIKVRSLESGEQKVSQGVIQLKPFHHLTMEVNPKRGLYSPLSKRNTFEVSIVNLGNTDHTIQLAGNDPEDACTYEFDQAQVTIGAGQQRHVIATVQPTSNRFVAGSRLIGFSITGRSVDMPAVAGTGQAQLEQRSLLSPSSLIVALLFLLVVGGWWFARPKPPGIQLTVDPMVAMEGSQVVVSWVAHDANRVKVISTEAHGAPITQYDGPATKSSTTIQVASPGITQIVAEVYKDAAQGPSDEKSVTVNPKPPVVSPTIKSFDASAHRVKTGDMVTFSWSVTGAAKVQISPFDDDLSPDLMAKAYPITPAGTYKYTLIATSPDGVTKQSEPVTVVAYDKSDASIVSFDASPSKVVSGQTTTITWQVLNASLVYLTPPGGTKQQVSASGTETYTITGKSQFVMTAYDAKGVSETKRITVDLQPQAPPPIPPDSTYPNTTGTTTDGGATATTGNPPSTTTGTATAGGANGR